MERRRHTGICLFCFVCLFSCCLSACLPFLLVFFVPTFLVACFPFVSVCFGFGLFPHRFLRQVFQVFAENSLSIDMVATSEVSISLTLDQEQDRAHLRR